MLSENHPDRRFYRELFIDLHDVPVLEERRLLDFVRLYDWRWGFEPVAELYIEMAREDLETIDYEPPSRQNFAARTYG